MSQVTVVIPLYNKEVYIEQALRSVMQQTLSGWQLILIDDASTDGSIDKISPYLVKENIKCIRLKTNIGLSNVLNYALTKITTPYFLHLDADDWLDPNALSVLLNAIKSNPNAALCYANHYVHWENDDGSISKTEQIVLEQYADRYDLLLKLNHALTPRLYRTSAVQEIGGWLTQSQQDLFVEDVQIQLRLASKYDWVWVNQFLHHRRKYKQNIEAFVQSRSDRWQYRYQLYNQILYEWGDEYKAVWNKIGDAIYLKELIKNDSPQNKINNENLPPGSY